MEADSREALIRGVQGLAIRTARAVNRTLGRAGRVWADRYHSRALGTPREVRNALVYVLNNMKKHISDARRPAATDPCSSAPWFTGWRHPSAPPPAGVRAPVVAAKTWLLGAGWRKHGLIDIDERPRPG